MIRFKIFGVKIEISFLLICLLNLILVSYGGRVLFFCVFSALFHEFCHVACLLFFGVKPLSLKFQINGIVLKDNANINDIKKTTVLVAGCVGNFVLFLLFYLAGLDFAMIANLALFIFNALPHEKLDGGQLLNIALQKIDLATSAKIGRIISNFVSLILIALSIIFIFKFRNYTLLIFIIMLNFSK